MDNGMSKEFDLCFQAGNYLRSIKLELYWQIGKEPGTSMPFFCLHLYIQKPRSDLNISQT